MLNIMNDLSKVDDSGKMKKRKRLCACLLLSWMLKPAYSQQAGGKLASGLNPASSNMDCKDDYKL